MQDYDLKEWVNRSLEIIKNDRKHFLPLGYREAVKRGLGPYNEQGNKR